jgi:signal transduction histidine kinase
MPWSEGPCSALLVRRPEREPPALGMLPPLEPLLVVLAVVLGAIMFAAGPVVRRIRALEREVRASAKEGYKTPLVARGRDEIAELARAFDEAGREVRAQIARQEQREKSLREFLANTTHDVNTPLTVLLGHLAELERQLATEAHPEAKARVAAALREAHYMASLLHNLALAARLDAGEPDPRRDRVDLTPLVERAVSRHRALAERLEVALERAVPEGALWVLGDMTMIEQAASNLIQNAVRHHRSGGHVAVILEEARPGLFSFRVVDDGPGIPEEEIPRLLERNRRGREARTRDPGGLGLGLDITRRVAEHHGFTLALRRSEMGGLEAELTGKLADA